MLLRNLKKNSPNFPRQFVVLWRFELCKLSLLFWVLSCVQWQTSSTLKAYHLDHHHTIDQQCLHLWDVGDLLESLTIDVLELHFGVLGPFIFTMAIKSSPSLSSWNVSTFEVLEEVSVGKWGGSNPIEPLQNEHTATAPQPSQCPLLQFPKWRRSLNWSERGEPILLWIQRGRKGGAFVKEELWSWNCQTGSTL